MHDSVKDKFLISKIKKKIEKFSHLENNWILNERRVKIRRIKQQKNSFFFNLLRGPQWEYK